MKIGDINKWKLKRSLISEGIVLYGSYKEIPENLKHYALIRFKPIKNVTQRNRIIRKLIGRKELNYKKKGLLEEVSGRMLSPTLIIIDFSKSSQIIKLFQKEKVDYQIFEIWSDQFNRQIKK